MTSEVKSLRQSHWTTSVLRFEGNCLLILFLFLLTFLAYGTIPNRLYHVLYVYGGSMQPVFSPGDIIVITPPPAVMEPGTILTLKVNEQLVTHRLVKMNANGTLVTQGDSNPVADEWGDAIVQVVGVYRFKIPYLGYIANLTSLFKPDATGSWFNDHDSIDFTISSMEQKPAKGTSIAASLSATGFYDEASMTHGVEGEVCVTNHGDVKTAGLVVNGQVEYNNRKSHGFEPLSDGTFTLQPDDALKPGETRCYPYKTTFTPFENTQYRLAAEVTITNHSGWLPGGHHCGVAEVCPFGPVVKSGFDLPAVVIEQQETVIPTDTLEPTEEPTITTEATDIPAVIETPIPTNEPEITEPQIPTEEPVCTDTPEPTETVPAELPEVTETPEPGI